jgi:glycosyltransferase involved in cell wall biosynthesis
MRILHVVSFISPDGAFGGPVRVAEHQTAALRERGHDVTLFAGQRGYDPPVPSGPAMRLFAARQVLPTGTFAGIAAPAMLPAAWREIRRVDVVHVHLARDLLTTPVALLVERLGVPYVLQPHGMIDQSDRRSAKVLDGLATRRLLRRASQVVVLRDAERVSLEDVAGQPLPVTRIRNAVPPAGAAPPFPGRPEVLFCARLHPRKRPLAFARRARTLLDEGVDASFVLVGPDEGEGPAVEREVARVADPARLRWEGPLDRRLVLERMAHSSMLVLPSYDEPFGMVLLEAMSLGRPVVLTESNGVAAELAELGCGVVVADDQASLDGAVRALLADPARLATLGARAHQVTADHFSLGAVAQQLESLYADAINDRRRPS